MYRHPKKTGFAVLLMSVLLSACGGGGGGAGGDQSPLQVCDAGEIILANGQCGPVPVVECDPPEVAVDGRCIVPDKPTPKYVPGPNEAVIYYNRRDKNFDGWVLHLWNNGCEAGSWDPSRVALRGPDGAVDYSYEGTGTSWPDGPPPNYQYYADGEADPIYGAYWVLQLQENGVCGNFIIHAPAGPPQTVDFRINFSEDTTNPYRNMYWVVVDSTLAENELREARAAAEPLCINDVCEEFEPPPLAVEDQAAHWIDANTIVWDRELQDVTLYGSPAGALEVATREEDGTIVGVVTGGQTAAALTATTLTDEQRARVPRLAEYSAYALDVDAAIVKDLLAQQLWIVGQDSDGNQYGTQLQLARALDAVYAAGAADAILGPAYDGDSITVSVWAPTAQDVKLRLYRHQPDGRLAFGSDTDMSLDADTGIWSATGAVADWDREYYRFVVTAYHASAGRTLVREARDPYSTGAYASSLASQFVNLDDAELKPDGWDGHAVPEVAGPEHAVIYEGHIRDFSIRDESTPEAHRGKYLAFTAADSAPVRHLRSLADAGLTHFHVLPAFDIRSVNEDPAQQVNLNNAIYELCRLDDSNEELCPGDEFDRTPLIERLRALDPATPEARDLVAAIADLDGFNWGYDPVLYNVPEGSYATDPVGAGRIREMRAMYQALHEMGLRVVMDVVYNHTSDEGADGAFSVFDRIVPGYYYRRNPTTGAVERASCCSDTAAENAMMGKFIKDSTVFWARHYKVDGFRFDWMSLHPKGLMEETLAAVRAVDADTYFYGEGWPPAAGTADAAFELADQDSMAGTGIGTFNDRLRDRLRALSISAGGDLARVRAGLAGNLAKFQLVLDSGVTIVAANDGGYTADPQESVNYASVHDGMTLWDQLNQGGVLPDAEAATAARVRMAVQAHSLVLLSQGVPFVHMGADLLRSKSLSRNSYNAGDWFNYVDFTGQSNNWNVGLPPEGPSDEDARAAIAAANAAPAAEDIATAKARFSEFLRIAQGSPLFSLATAEEVIDRVGFHNVGRGVRPNLIAMSIDDGAGIVTNTEDVARADLDPDTDAIVVVFNGDSVERSLSIRTATGFSLHAAQASSVDETVRAASFTENLMPEEGGLFTVPALTTAVFVKAQGAAQGSGLSAFVTSGFEPPVPYGDTPIFLRGQFNGWGADPLSYVGGGAYEGYLALDAGDYEFKIASEDWSTVDIAAPEGEGAVAIGEPIALSAAGRLSNLSMTVPAAGEYRFLLDALDAAAPVLTVTNARALPAPTFVRGAFNGWSADDELQYVGQGVYQAAIDIDAGEHGFKVASEDWNTVDLSATGEGGFGDGVPVELDTDIALAGPRGANMLVSIAESGTYLFTVAASGFFSDDSGQGGATLWIAPAEPYAGTPIYLRGAFNGWGTDNEMTFQGAATYRTDIDLDTETYAFKVASEDWATVNIGAGDEPTVTVGVPLAVVDAAGTPNLSMTIGEAGSYAFTVDASRGALALQVRKSSDVPMAEPPPPPPEPALEQPLTFDEAGVSHLFEDDPGVVTAVIADPLAGDGENQVASTTKSAGAAADAGVAYAFDGAAIAFSDELTHIAVDVYRVGEAEAMVSATVHNGASDDVASLQATAAHGGSGDWETLYFDFSAFDPDAVYNRLRLVFDAESEGAGDAWHWDNVRLAAPPPGTTPPFGNTVVYVRGLAGDWGTTNAMTYVGNGLYHLDLSLAPHPDGDHPFKVASEDWATVNFGAPSAAQNAVVADEPKVLAATDDNLALNVAETGNYRFRLDANDAAAPTLTVVDLDGAPYGYGMEQSAIFVRGAFNEWGTGNELYYAGRGVHQAVVEVAEAGEYEFKVASDDWATVNLGAADAAATVAVGVEFSGFLAGSNDNLAISIDAAGAYLFTLDASGSIDVPSLWVTPFKLFGDLPAFVRGGMNEWGTADELVFKGGARYAATIDLEVATYQFKIASEDWATVNLGAADASAAEVTLGEPYAGLAQGSDANLTIGIAEGGIYRFEIDGTKTVPPTLTVQSASD